MKTDSIIRLNRNQLKYLAILAMLLDHIAWGFVPLDSAAGQIMHFFGRLTGPTMAYFLAEGYLHTRNLQKYLARMGFFALLSWPAYSFFRDGHLTFAFGVIYTLFLGLAAICVWDRALLPLRNKILLILGLCFLSLAGDWAVFDVIWPLFLFIDRNDAKKKWNHFMMIGVLSILTSLPGTSGWEWIYMLGVPAAIWFLHAGYDGKPGSRHAFHKWFFYIFYPAHLLILGILRWYLMA